MATAFRPRPLPLVARTLLDFALPPRCAACGTIVDEVDSFCAGCWRQIDFLGDGGCETCGPPLEGTEARTCAACLAQPPRIDRTRAAVAYDDLTRGLAVRLKYGRKVALARTMARFMAPLLSSETGQILVPVPLHRGRMWQRGFNQAVLVARALSRRTGVPVAPGALQRVKRTPPLKGMTPDQRRRTVTGAFAVREPASIAGRSVILVDDVLTSGATAEACAGCLQRAGAKRVELISWARVIRPNLLTR